MHQQVRKAPSNLDLDSATESTESPALFCPFHPGSARCMDGACIVRAPVPGQEDWQEEFMKSRPWEVVAEKGYTGAELAELLQNIIHATRQNTGELHFGIHPPTAYHEVELVSSAAHLSWMRRAAESDAFIRTVLHRSEQMQVKHGPHSLLRISEDFIGEIATMPVSALKC